MKEQLYTIPVTDAFKEDTECPICSMYRSLEAASISYTMGPSYMEDDVRAQTDKEGFCEKHLGMMYQDQNRLGLALILSTHMDETIRTIEKLGKTQRTSSSLFKKTEASPLSQWLKRHQCSCFVCNRVEHTFQRYLATIFHLYKHEKDFRDTFQNGRGFCTKHFGMLYDMAPFQLKGDTLQTFTAELVSLYLDNMKRVRDDLEWYKDKFDYRNADAPWRNSRDALPRTLIKTNGILLEKE